VPELRRHGDGKSGGLQAVSVNFERKTMGETKIKNLTPLSERVMEFYTVDEGPGETEVSRLVSDLWTKIQELEALVIKLQKEAA
jgi:hypothetical protein